ncbi:hypothetical protein FXO38_03724 [Capsicum annuum]|nr:hypothetical protein FXO38_03724 [Capsicum annuum]
MVFALPSMARHYGFRPAMISSLARSVGFRPSMNSSSLILCHSRPNGGSTTFATATHTEEIARRSVQLPWLMLQPPESTSVYKFYRMSKNDVKVVAVGSTQDPSDSYSQFLGSPFLGCLVQYFHCVPHIRPDSLPYKTLGFDVFKFDFINDHHLVKLSLLEDIGDRAIFLDKRRCFAFSTTQFPELRPGSIYFADGNYKWKYNFGGHDMGICNYADDRIIDQIPFPVSCLVHSGC